jgi:hypothetical protein
VRHLRDEHAGSRLEVEGGVGHAHERRVHAPELQGLVVFMTSMKLRTYAIRVPSGETCGSLAHSSSNTSMGWRGRSEAGARVASAAERTTREVTSGSQVRRMRGSGAGMESPIFGHAGGGRQAARSRGRRRGGAPGRALAAPRRERGANGVRTSVRPAPRAPPADVTRVTRTRRGGGSIMDMGVH